MSVDGDLLSAASLALGALAVVYGLWSPALLSVLDLEKAPHREDRDPTIRSLREASRVKALPLLVAATGVCLILMPPAVDVAIRSIGHLVDQGPKALLDYDPVQALFLAVWCMIAGLAVVSAKSWNDVRNKLSEFERT